MLLWNWNDKIGELVEELPDGNEYTYNIYHGNALLIVLAEWTDEFGVQCHTLHSFISDENHLKNLLGLGKNFKENVVKDWGWKELRLDTNYKGTAKIVAALAKSKTPITIRLY